MSENTEIQSVCELANKNAQTTQNEIETTLKNNERIAQLENELKQKDVEIEAYKKHISQLEDEVAEVQKFKAQHLKESEEVEALKIKSEDTLTKAKGIIFERTKVIKNQELQIEALNQQISSLKDVVSITKDLLEIRNLEVKQLESKIQCMEDKVGAEKERHDLMHKKLEHMIRYNGDLKREYETQLCLFSALRERYSERELARGVLDEANAQLATSSAVEANPQPVEAEAEASTSQVNGEIQEEKTEDTTTQK